MGATYLSIQADTTDRNGISHLTVEQQEQLVAYLSDTRDILYSADILKTFCQAAGIRNVMTSYDYIQRNDYAADLDTPVQLVKIG